MVRGRHGAGRRGGSVSGHAPPHQTWTLRMGIRSRKALRRAVGGALGVMLVIAAGAAAIAEDEEDEDSIEMKAIKGIMRGLGVQVDRAGIDYRERSPLVIPPTRDLPPPENDVSAKTNNAAWPVDADVKRRQAAAAGAR